MPNRTEKPNMTDGRAALVVIMDRYLRGQLAPFVSLLEVHKLLYFLQEAGQPLRLKYEAGKFGPYAENLRQVLIKVEGHFLVGYGEGNDAPTTPIELVPGTIEAASEWMSADAETGKRMDRVTELIAGFEDPYGMELLSSVHWVMCMDKNALNSVEDAIAAVFKWNERKAKILKPEHLRKAWARLKEFNWDTESRSAMH